MKNLFFLASMFIFFFSVYSNDKKEATTILCLGDSLTAGYGLEREFSYPSLLQKKISVKGNFKVINAGVSGNTSAGGLRRVEWYFKSKIDVLLLALGANDGLRGIETASTQKNLQMIIDKAKKMNSQVKIIIAGMKVPPNMGKEYFSSFEKIFPDLAKKNNCALIPFLLEGVGGMTKLNQADGIHPNKIGQQRLCENIYVVLKKVLELK
jgi:acyl-CoA thioesterase I